MKRWAIVTVVLYAAILVALVFPVAYLAFLPEFQPDDMLGLVLFWPLWAWLGLMVVSQVALLVVPVRLANRRPVTRGWVLWPLVAAAIAVLVLLAGMLFVAHETMHKILAEKNRTVVMTVFCVIIGFWVLWALVFGFYAGGRPPKTMMSRISKFLIAGSILELLVALPAHIIARTKGYCSAGLSTIWGLAAGIAVMLFAFGPSVFVLFARRFASLRQRRSS